MTRLLHCAPPYRRALLLALGLTLLAPLAGFKAAASASAASWTLPLYSPGDMLELGLISALGGVFLGGSLGGLRRAQAGRAIA